MNEVNRRQKDNKSKAGNTVEGRKLSESIQTTEGRKADNMGYCRQSKEDRQTFEGRLKTERRQTSKIQKKAGRQQK